MVPERVALIRAARHHLDSRFCEMPRDIIESLLVPMVAIPPSPCTMPAPQLAFFEPPMAILRENVVCGSCAAWIRYDCTYEFYDSVTCHICCRDFPVCTDRNPPFRACGFVKLSEFTDGLHVCRWCAAEEGAVHQFADSRVNQLNNLTKRLAMYKSASAEFAAALRRHCNCTVEDILQACNAMAVCNYEAMTPLQYDQLVDSALAMAKAITQEKTRQWLAE
jgi:hypothetical protein